MGEDLRSDSAGPSTPAEYGVPERAGLRNLGSHRMASYGGSWNCPAGGGRRVRGGAGCAAVLNPLHQLFAVLLRFERRRTKLAEVPARFPGRALAGAGARGQSPLCGPAAGPGLVDRWAVGG